MTMFKFMRGRRNPDDDDDDDDMSASDDAPMRGGSNASSRRGRGGGGGGGGHQKQRQHGQGGRQVGGRGTSIDRSTSSHQPSLLRRTNGVDKAHHRGGNRSWMSDTCSETDGNETWTTTEGGECGPDSGSGSGSGSGCGEWSEDGSGEGGGGRAVPLPPPPVPPPQSRRGGGATGRANVSGVDSTNGGIGRGSGGGGHGGGEELVDNKIGRGRGLSRSNSLGDVPPPSPRGVPNAPQPVASRGPAARAIPPPPSFARDACDVDGGGDERSMKIKPPSIRGMQRARKSKSLTRSDPTLMSSMSYPSSSSSKSWGPDGRGGGTIDGARAVAPVPAAAPIAEGEAMQRLAQLVVSLRVELRESNAAREELESRLLLVGESRGGQSATTLNDDDDARLRLREENDVLRADVDALFAEQDDLRGEVAELRDEKRMLNDVIARLKREGGGGGGADASVGGASRASSIVSHKRNATSSSVQDLEGRIADLTDENRKLESEIQLLVGEKSQLINTRGLESEEFRRSLAERESRSAEMSAEKDRIIKEMQETIDTLREERDGLEKAVAESKMTAEVLEDELQRQDRDVEDYEAKSNQELQLLRNKLAQAERDIKLMQERSSVADRVLLEQKKTVEELLRERHARREFDDIKEYDKSGNVPSLQNNVASQEKSTGVLKDELHSKSVIDQQAIRDHHDMIASLQERTAELETEVNEANGAISMLEDDLDRKDAQVKELLNKLTILHQKVSRAEQSNAALCRENKELISKNDDFETSYKIMTIENKAAKEELEMWTSMKHIEDDATEKDHLQHEVEQLLQELEELRDKTSYKKTFALEEQVFQLQEDKKKILQDLDESSDAIMTLGDALKDLEATLAVRDSEMRKLKVSLDEKETSLKSIMSAQKEHQYERQSSADMIATLKIKIASLEAANRDLEKELNANTQAFLELKDEKSDEAAVVTDLETKLIKATEENGTLTRRITRLITANEKMKEEVKELGESLATCNGHPAVVVAAKTAHSSSSSAAAFPSCAVSSDPMTSCDALISELREKIKEIVSSRNSALEEVALLRCDASVATSVEIERPIGPSTPTVEMNNGSSAISTGLFQQVQASASRVVHESISLDEDDDERSTKSCEKTTAYSRSPSNSGSRGSSLLEAAKKLCIKLEEKKVKEGSNKTTSRTIPESALLEASKRDEAVPQSSEDKIKNILDQDDGENSAKEVKEDSPIETTGMSDVNATSPSSPPSHNEKKNTKHKIDIDQLTSIYFEKSKSGMSSSKFSDVSWSSNSSRPKHPNNCVIKKVRICRNGIFMGTYEGELNAEGQRHGTGVLLCDNGNSYEGEWKKDKRDGLGVARYSSGDVYDGQWQRGRRQGHGIMYIELGDTYVGNWNNGLKHGAGTYHWVDGEVDVSWYEEDRRVGEGVRWSADRLKAFRLVRGTKKEELPLDVAYATAERLGLSLEKFEL